MTDQIKEKLNQAAIDAETAIERFMGNEGLYLKYLCRFSEDDTYQELQKALDSSDCQNAFVAAHTLKGVCGNLGMERMTAVLTKQVEYLRKDDMQNAEELMKELQEAYVQVRTVLACLNEAGLSCTEK